MLAKRPSKEIKYLAVFILTFSLMQIADALIWFGLGTNNRALNAVTSKYVVPAILAAELLVAYYAAVHFLGWRNKWYEASLWVIAIGLYISWVIDCKKPVTKPNVDGNLVWCNTSMAHWSRTVFLFYLVFPFVMAYPNGWIKTSVLTLGIGTWLMNWANPAFGSRWCWASNSMSVAAAILVLMGRK